MRIVSFHNGNIDPEILEYQERVLSNFSDKSYQIHTNMTHGDAIDYFLSVWHDNIDEIIMILDIDAIPLNQGALIIAEASAKHGNLYGAAQQANHILGSGIYVSPACICFSKKTYDKLGKPSFVADEFGDVGYKMTQAAIEKEVYVDLIYPVHVETPKWNLGNNSTFGHGTTYQNGIYHAFESRMGNTRMFINKCKSVLNEK